MSHRDDITQDLAICGGTFGAAMKAYSSTGVVPYHKAKLR